MSLAHFPEIFAPPPEHEGGRWQVKLLALILCSGTHPARRALATYRSRSAYRSPCGLVCLACAPQGYRSEPLVLSNQENYCFDCAGYICVPNVLDAPTLATLRAAVRSAGAATNLLDAATPGSDAIRELLVQPELVNYLNQLIGAGWRLDQLPVVAGGGISGTGGPLVGGDEPHQPARSYYIQAGKRSSQVVRAVWCLEDVADGDGGLAVVQASHKSNVLPPPALLAGGDCLGLAKQLAGQAGDLWLIAGATMMCEQAWASAPRQLLSFEFCGRAALLSPGNAAKISAHAGLGVADPARIRAEAAAEGGTFEATTAASRAVLGGPDDQPVLLVDETGRTVLAPPEHDHVHPSILKLDTSGPIDHEEFFKWDLNGYLVIPGVMDAAWLQAANDAVDAHQDKIQVGGVLSGGSVTQTGTGRPLLGGLANLPDGHGEPFQRMLAHPAVPTLYNYHCCLILSLGLSLCLSVSLSLRISVSVQCIDRVYTEQVVGRLNWMGGSGYRCGGGTLFCAEPG